MGDPRSYGLRRELGRRLRVVRTSAGLSGPQLAERLPFSQSKISRIEGAALWPPLADIRLWLDVCGAPEDERRRIMTIAESIEQGVTVYREPNSPSLTVRQLELSEMDEDASTLHQFAPSLVPGLLQTAAYTRACVIAAGVVEPRRVDEAVAARLERAARVREAGSPHVDLLVMEAALRWVPLDGGVAATVEALRGLADAARSGRVTVRVIPTGTPMGALPLGSFVIVDWREPDEPPIVLADTAAAEITFTDEPEIAEFRTAWDALTDAALDPQASLAFLDDLADELTKTAT